MKEDKSGRHKRVIDIGGTDDIKTILDQDELPVIVDFWAPWCGPCKAMAPVFEQAAEKSYGQMLFAKINTEANPELGKLFSIRSIPTLVVFYEGEIIDVRIGKSTAPALATMIQRGIDKSNGVGVFGKIKRMFTTQND